MPAPLLLLLITMPLRHASRRMLMPLLSLSCYAIRHLLFACRA